MSMDALGAKDSALPSSKVENHSQQDNEVAVPAETACKHTVQELNQVTLASSLRGTEVAVPSCKHTVPDLNQAVLASNLRGTEVAVLSCKHTVPDLNQVVLAFSLKACPSSTSTNTGTTAGKDQRAAMQTRTKKNDHERDSQTVLNAYVVGSHLWGTCHTGSDWDLIIVLDGPKLTNYKMNAHKGNLEACIVSKDLYLSSLREHSMQFLATLWIPKRFIVIETFDPRSYFHLHRPTLLKALEELRDRDVRVARKHFMKSDLKRARRTVTHCVTFLKLAGQMVTSGKITDYQCVREEKAGMTEMLARGAGSWEEVIAPVEAAMKLLLEYSHVAS